MYESRAAQTLTRLNLCWAFSTADLAAVNYIAIELKLDVSICDQNMLLLCYMYMHPLERYVNHPLFETTGESKEGGGSILHVHDS